MLRLFVLCAVAILLAVAPPPAKAQAPGELAVTVGAVLETGVERGVVWFQFGRQRRLLIPRADSPDPRTVIAALKASRKTGRSVFASYDPHSGEIDAEGRVTFVVRRLTYDGRVIEGAREQRQVAGPGTPRVVAARAIARSIALRDLGRLDEARAAVRGALASGDLEPRLRKSALRSQAVVTAQLAHELGPESRVEADELLIETLHALQAALILEPGDHGLIQALAQTLTQLGAYEDALKVYEALVAADPEQAYWPTLNVVIVQRLLGRPDQALATLDGLVDSNGPQDGMAFHYHRGWTLSDLGRYEEAISEFTVGLEAQPDYQWALVKRACAEASLGRHGAALADQQRAVTLAEQTVAASPGLRAATYNLERAKAVLETLQAAVAKGEATGIKDLCTGYWPADEERRPRSPILPQEAIAPRDNGRPT